jgi:RNA polymerase sigma-70 factor (ECF subfamily)
MSSIEALHDRSGVDPKLAFVGAVAKDERAKRVPLQHAIDSSNREGGADFREALIRQIPQARAFARSLTGNAERADDLCQDALARAWQSRASFEPGTNIKAWLFVILRNQFYTERRRAWRERPAGKDEVEKNLVSRGNQEAAMTLSDVANAMRLLSDDQREALILVGAGGFSYEEAAAICGCAIGTMKSRVSRARHNLEAIMDGKQVNNDRRGTSNGEVEILAELRRLSPARIPAISNYAKRLAASPADAAMEPFHCSGVPSPNCGSLLG